MMNFTLCFHMFFRSTQGKSTSKNFVSCQFSFAA